MDKSSPNRSQIAASKHNLKGQNICIKPPLKPQNTFNRPCFETDYLSEIVKGLFKQKVAQNDTVSLCYFIFSKHTASFPK